MMKSVRWTIVAAALCAALPAYSAISCSISSNPAEVKLIYNYFSGNATGTVNIACTRDPRDERRPWMWIGMDQTTAGRTATLDTGGSTLNYEIFHSTGAAGTWTGAGTGVDPGSTTNGPILERLDFGGGGSTSLTDSFTFYVNVPWLQFSPAGVYVDSVPITMRLNNAAGPVVSTGTLPVYISIPRACRFSTPPTPVSINYQAFATAPATGTSNFAITCTQGTNYTLSLDQASGVVPNVELFYTLSLTTTSATGAAVAQPYTVEISVPPGQAGRCNTSTCTGTDTRTLTVTY